MSDFFVFDAQYKYLLNHLFVIQTIYMFCYCVGSELCVQAFKSINNNKGSVQYNYKFYIYGWANAKVELNE